MSNLIIKERHSITREWIFGQWVV